MDSIRRQSFRDFELIIADDGSGEDTKKLIEEFKRTVEISVTHCWHKDKGFRKSKIHNEAIRAAKGELLIFIDGDCVLAPHFLEDHVSIYEKFGRHKYVLMGRRLELGPKLTDQLTLETYPKFLFSWLSLPFLISLLNGETRNPFRKYSINNRFLRKLLKADKVVDLLGCNFSLRKSEMLEINGFNEDFEGYGLEDFDIFLRLKNLGCNLVGKKCFAVQFHLFHPRRPEVDNNKRIYFEKKTDESYIKAENGLVNLT